MANVPDDMSCVEAVARRIKVERLPRTSDFIPIIFPAMSMIVPLEMETRGGRINVDS